MFGGSDMIVLVEQRELVADGFQSLFKREGVCISAMPPAEFSAWFRHLPDAELAMIEAVLIGDSPERLALGPRIHDRPDIPVFALLDAHRLEETLALFDAGFDDVLRKPMHVREILARIRVARSRRNQRADAPTPSGLRLHFDGRAPCYNGVELDLPRRERRILEILHQNAGRRISKAQLFAAVYGLDDETIEETVVESHISKLRKKLRNAMGWDPISSQRFLGYCLQAEAAPMRERRGRAKAICAPSLAQAAAA
jgi:two-component system, OmpR family, flagellar system response regulator FtcR